MSTILSDQVQAIEAAANQGLAAAGSALTQPIMLAIFTVVFGPSLVFGIYKLLKVLAQDDLGLEVSMDWDSNSRRKK